MRVLQNDQKRTAISAMSAPKHSAIATEWWFLKATTTRAPR
ncbi:hypothetical protein [Streptosporangium sp. G12]